MKTSIQFKQLMNNGKNKLLCVYLDKHRPVLRLGRKEYNLKGNIINLHSGCVIQADWKDKGEIKVYMWDSAEHITYCRVSNSSIFVMQSSFQIGKHSAYLVSVDS